MSEKETFQRDRVETARDIRVHDASNAMQLSGRQWLALAGLAGVLLTCTPSAWKRLEPFPATPDFRMPYALGNDYWLYDRFTRAAADRDQIAIVGDSVMWGPYVLPTQSLSHALNDLVGRARFANLGLDGAHPAALAGLLQYHTSGLQGRDVILACNLLWLSSPKHDLREVEEFDFNHPGLVPQFLPRIPCYHANISDRLGRIIDRHSDFTSWSYHLQQAYFGSSSIPEWTLEHPYTCPLSAVTRQIPSVEKKLKHAPEPWTRQGITPQDFPWVDLAGSPQWRSFQRAIDILQRRHNRVTVLICPFNEHLLTPESRARFAALKAEVESALRARGLPVIAPPLLPSELYADASHPLADGYRQMAKSMADCGLLP